VSKIASLPGISRLSHIATPGYLAFIIFSESAMTILTRKHTAATLLSVATVLAAGVAGAAINQDFTNPAVAISNDAIVASGTCIAKFAARLDDGAKPVTDVAQLVAQRCAKEISRSAGLAAWMMGKPEDFAKNVQYTRQELTVTTIERARAAKRHEI
jgi:hypothetical protein